MVTASVPPQVATRVIGIALELRRAAAAPTQSALTTSSPLSQEWLQLPPEQAWRTVLIVAPSLPATPSYAGCAIFAWRTILAGRTVPAGRAILAGSSIFSGRPSHARCSGIALVALRSFETATQCKRHTDQQLCSTYPHVPILTFPDEAMVNLRPSTPQVAHWHSGPKQRWAFLKRYNGQAGQRTRPEQNDPGADHADQGYGHVPAGRALCLDCPQPAERSRNIDPAIGRHRRGPAKAASTSVSNQANSTSAATPGIANRTGLPSRKDRPEREKHPAISARAAAM
jgi:hypothetical protein